MLLEITIKNFAIIEEISLNFENGMTVLTGETGAGKSIIIDAMNHMSESSHMNSIEKITGLIEDSVNKQ